jgi:hypothetical protein
MTRLRMWECKARSRMPTVPAFRGRRWRAVPVAPPVLYEEQPSLGAGGNCEGVAPFAARVAIARVVASNGAL